MRHALADAAPLVVYIVVGVLFLVCVDGLGVYVNKTLPHHLTVRREFDAEFHGPITWHKRPPALTPATDRRTRRTQTKGRHRRRSNP